MREIGAEDCVNYREKGESGAYLRLCPDGVDAIFEHVGGAMLDHLLPHLTVTPARSCALRSPDTTEAVAPPLHNWLHLLINRVRMQGFICLDHRARFNVIEAGGAPQALRRHKRRPAARAGRTLMNRVHPTATPSRRTPTHQRGVPPCRPY